MACGADGVTFAARLNADESFGDRILKVDHAGEHGAVCIYTAQRSIARLRAPDMVAELEHFLAHEKRHRALFEAEMVARGVRRCKSYHLCALGGYALGTVSALLGRDAIAATTVAIERVVLKHLREQLATLSGTDAAAAEVLRDIIAEEQEHHDTSARHLARRPVMARILDSLVAASTEAVIWLGMRL